MKSSNVVRSRRLPIGKLCTPYALMAYGVFVAGGLASQAVWAQASPPAPVAQDESQTLDTVVVTARRNREKAQDVPLAITAFTSQQLEDAGVKNLSDVTKLTSGVTVTDAGAEVNLAPTIRGLTNLSGGQGDPNVAVFLDGIYLSNSSAFSLADVDFERIEVVKGPVSALYGRDAFAGAINYVTKKGTDQLEGSIAATVGDYDAWGLNGSISGALNPGVLKMHLGFNFDATDGTYKDNTTGQSAGGHNKKDVQLGFELTPTNRLTITGGVYHGEDLFKQMPEEYVTNNCGPKETFFPPYYNQYEQYCGEIPGTQRPVEVAALSSAAGEEANKRNFTNLNTKVSYDLGFADISTLLGYDQVTERAFEDFTGHRYGLPFELVPGPGTVTLPELFGDDNNNRDKSIEIRLASKQDQRLRGSIGYYFYEATQTTSTLIGLDGGAVPPGQGLGFVGIFETPTGAYSQSNLTRTVDTDQVDSGFGNVDFDILPNLTASAEYRGTQEDKSQDLQRNAFVANTFRPEGPPTHADFNFDNYRAALTWKVTPVNMLYASIADGTKAGGFNSEATIASEISFKPETNRTYEFGSKNNFFDNTLQLNAAVFHIDSKSLQIDGPSDDPHNTGLVVKNFGGTSDTGFELDLLAKPLRGLTVNAGIGYADPEFTAGTYDFSSSDVALCPLIPSCGAGRITTVGTKQGPTQAINLQGLTPPAASKVTFNFGAQYVRPVSDRWTSFSRIDVRYQTKQYSYAVPLDINYWGASTNVNLRTGIEDEHYSLTFFINNVTNNQVPAFAGYNVRLNDFIGQEDAYLPPQRTFGATLSYRF